MLFGTRHARRMKVTNRFLGTKLASESVALTQPSSSDLANESNRMLILSPAHQTGKFGETIA